MKVFSASCYNENYKGFYKKLRKFIEILVKQNDLVADSLMRNNFNACKN